VLVVVRTGGKTNCSSRCTSYSGVLAADRNDASLIRFGREGARIALHATVPARAVE